MSILGYMTLALLAVEVVVVGSELADSVGCETNTTKSVRYIFE